MVIIRESQCQLLQKDEKHDLIFMRSYFIRRMVSSGMLRRVAFVRTNVSEELSPSFIIRVTRIGELGTTLAVTSNRRTLPHGVTSQKTPFFIVTAVKTSDVTYFILISELINQCHPLEPKSHSANRRSPMKHECSMALIPCSPSYESSAERQTNFL
jgi:hypothetical protein